MGEPAGADLYIGARNRLEERERDSPAAAAVAAAAAEGEKKNKSARPSWPLTFGSQHPAGAGRFLAGGLAAMASDQRRAASLAGRPAGRRVSRWNNLKH